MRYFFVIFTVLFCVTACKTAQKRAVPIVYPVKEVVDMELPLGQPLKMVVVDDRLILSDFRTDNLVWVFDLENKTVINKLLHKGRGPSEGMPPVDIIANRDSVLFFARGSGSLFVADTDSLFAGRGSLKSARLPDVRMGRFTPLNDSFAIASGQFEEGRYAIIDTYNGNVVEFTGEYPAFWSEDTNMPNWVKSFAHSSSFACAGNKLAILTSHTLSICDVEGRRQGPITEILLDRYEYEYFADASFRTAKMKEGISSGAYLLTANKQNIYFVFSYSGSPDAPFDHAVIFQYDWQGNHVKTIDINEDVQCLAVDESNEYLYALVIQSSSLQYELMKIDLRDL